MRVPLVQFVALGAVLFGLARALEQPFNAAPIEATECRQVTFTHAEAARLVRAWERHTARVADPATRAALVEAAIEEEMLAQEARRRDLGRNDPAVWARLVEQMRFLGNGPEPSQKSVDDRTTRQAETTEELVKRARALGLERSDPLIRRILAGRMRAVLAPPASADDGDDATRRAWFTAHASRFAQPERVNLQQLPLPAPATRAGPTLREQLQGGALSFEEARPLARPLPLPGELRQASAARLATIFGADFARAAMQLEPGSWQGPIASAFGPHLVRVQARLPATPPVFEQVETQVRLALRTERHDARLTAAIAALRARYKIHRPPAIATLAPPGADGAAESPPAN